jgi:ABC-type multidrug transport system ATPase subunit
LIDEPTAGVEPRIAALIYDLIKGLASDGKAVLLEHQARDRDRRLRVRDADRHDAVGGLARGVRR